jgi:hypothetical protein
LWQVFMSGLKPGPTVCADLLFHRSCSKKHPQGLKPYVFGGCMAGLKPRPFKAKLTWLYF